MLYREIESKVKEQGSQLEQIENNKVNKEELNALGKLELSGEYATLDALKLAKPTGANGLYLVLADGFTYRWSGSEWIKSAQFQSTGIGDNTVTNSKIRDFNFNKGHINEVVDYSLFHSQYAQGYSYDIFTGEFNFTTLSNDHSGMFLKIDYSKIIDYVYLVVNGIYFTGTNVPIYTWNPSSTNDFALFGNITKDGIYKIPKELFTSNRQILVNVLKGTTVKCENLWVSYAKPKHFNPSLKKKLYDLENNIDNKVNGSYKSKNLYDKSKNIDGYFVDWKTGKLKALSGFSASEFIKLDNTLPYRHYSKNGFACNQVAFYDEDRIYISGIQNPSGLFDSTHDNIPQNAVYIRLTIDNSVEEVMFYQSDSNDIPKYYPYGELLDYNHLVNIPVEKKEIIVNKNGGKDYTSLKLAVEEAIKYNGTKVIVEEGTYNLIEEFGTTFFESFQLGQAIQGIMLCNDVHIIFSPMAKVICHYTGSNLNVEQDFSPFTVKIGNGGFTLEGLNLECSRVRYPIHDEHYGDNVYYKNHYKNCNIVFTWNTKTKNNYKNCIGGGLSKHGEILIENCIFESKDLTTTTGIVSYHNSYSHDSGARSEVVIRDSYFVGEYATARASYLGKQTDVSICKIMNCSLGKEPFVEAEKGATVVNMKIYAFNNEIRE